jgi:hypothetical protein
MRRTLILAALLRCSDECDENPPRSACSTRELVTRTEPWPTFDERIEQLRCACNSPSFGMCSDGKQFVADGFGFAGETLYFREGSVVGRWRWSDVAGCLPGEPLCSGRGSGDVDCDETTSEVIPCVACE